MKVDRHVVAAKLIDYLHHRLTLDELVAWAEQVMMDGEFDETDFETVRDIVSRLGLADVQVFGLTWADCESYLHRLGYEVRIEVAEAA